MRLVAIALFSLLVMTIPTFSQLPRIGSGVSKSVQNYFGIARRIDNIDSLRVVRTQGITFYGVRNGVDVDSVSFSQDEIPILERYLREYESMLSQKADVFIVDTAMRRILGRVAPRQFYNPRVNPISVRLTDGSVKTGIPLVATDNQLLLSDSIVFIPHEHLSKGLFSCIPTAIIDALTDDVGLETQRWYRVDGDVMQFRSAINLACPRRSYEIAIPPEFQSCVPGPQDTFESGAPLSLVCPRRKGWSFAGYGGFLTTMIAPQSVVLTSTDGSIGNSLRFQQTTYSFGVDASIAANSSFDIGIRGTINAQPPTIDDPSLQNSLGMDEYLLQFLGTWHVLAIDDIGYRKLGISTTIGLGPAFLWYRTRTFRDVTNLTSTGSGFAFDASFNLQMMYAVSQAVAIGFRGTATYQLGLSASFNDVVWPEEGSEPWVASFTMVDQTAAFLGAHVVVTYTLP